MPSPLAALALGLALLASPAQGAQPAPEQPPAGAPADAAAPRTPSASVQEAPATQGLPRRAPEPRTMREFWPVFAALALSWVGIVGYVLALGRRSGRIARAVFEAEAE